MTTPNPLDTRSVLPAFLACLSTALASPKPSSALLPLLSPILSQRVQLLSESPDCSSWLTLLNWDDQEATQLPKIVREANLEPHPISGEVEVGDIEPTKYRRIDEEAFQALVEIPDAGLAIVHLWCTADGKQQWRVAELKPICSNGSRNPVPWEATLAGAEEAFENKAQSPAIAQQENNDDDKQEQEEEDDDYWNRYDNTPGRTPARTPAQEASASKLKTASSQNAKASDEKYWAQYEDVQPALDSEDPDERAANKEHMGESSLDGNTLMGSSTKLEAESSIASVTQQRSMFTPNGTRTIDESSSKSTQQRSLFTPNGTSIAGMNGFTIFPPTAPETRHSPADTPYEHIEHPRPQSAQSSTSSGGSSRLVEQLEGQAERANTTADIAIQQHISTSFKSLYRLAKGAGMDRTEFERIVNAELGVLSMLDDD